MGIFDEIKAQSRKARKKGRKAWLSWFWTYYKFQTLGAIIVAAILISVIHSIATNKPEALSVVFLNVESEDGRYGNVSDTLSENLAAETGIDTSKNTVSMDLSNYIAPGGAADQMQMASSEKIIAYTSAKTLDLLGGDAYNFCDYASVGMYADLRDVLSDEQIKKYEPYFYYIDNALIEKRSEASQSTDTAVQNSWKTGTILDAADASAASKAESRSSFTAPDPKTMQDPVPVGIILTDAPYFSGLGLYEDAVPVIGVVANSKHTDAAVRAVDFLWSGNSAANQ